MARLIALLVALFAVSVMITWLIRNAGVIVVLALVWWAMSRWNRGTRA